MLNIIINIILFVLILGVVVFVHELGHFLFAKLVGVHVYEFALGMGPKLFSKTGKDETVYSLRVFPIGGFCSLAGEEVDVDSDKQKGKNIQDKNLFQRFLVMFMGVGFNFIFAFLVLFFIGIFAGAPNLTPVISEVAPNMPAEVAGLSDGDKVLKINNRKVTYLDDIMLFLTLEDLSKPIKIEVQKLDGTKRTYELIPEKQVEKDKEDTYIVGITVASKKERGLIKSIVYAFKQECALVKQMIHVLRALFTGKLGLNQLSGPVGIYTIVGEMKSEGAAALIYLIALLSINVGIINLIPLPAFDGGRILFLVIEKIKGSPISTKVENTIHAIGFILLILLMLYITFNDILKLF